MSESQLASHLAEHPRMIGVLFTMLLLLTSAGNAAAGATIGTSGP